MPASIQQRLARIERIIAIRKDGLQRAEQVVERFGVCRTTAHQDLRAAIGGIGPRGYAPTRAMRAVRLERIETIKAEGLLYSDDVMQRFHVSNPTAIAYLRAAYGELPPRESAFSAISQCPHCGRALRSGPMYKHVRVCIYDPAKAERYRTALSSDVPGVGVSCEQYEARRKLDRSLPYELTLRKQINIHCWGDVLAVFGLTAHNNAPPDPTDEQAARRVALGAKWQTVIERGLTALEQEHTSVNLE